MGLIIPSGMTVLPRVASTSGVSIDFTNIPSAAKFLLFSYFSVSMSGVSPWLLQLGSGSIDTAGYVGGGGDRGGEVANAAGFVVNRAPAAANLHSGLMLLVLQDLATFSYSLSGALSLNGSGQPNYSGGAKSLSGLIDRVRFTTVGGADTFDGGSLGLAWGN